MLQQGVWLRNGMNAQFSLTKGFYDRNDPAVCHVLVTNNTCKEHIRRHLSLDVRVIEIFSCR